MENSPQDSSIIAKLRELEEKYALTGQDLLSSLEGLKQANYLKYWDYIHLDTLLSLQNPRTDFLDERIFIVYHQITELYFRLIIWEIEQITHQKPSESKFFLERMQRINRYMLHLVNSFDVMVDGMEVEQFRQFRMALLPASGFQSAQFRMIEICATDFYNLLEKSFQNNLTAKADIEETFAYSYWMRGANDEKTGQETITSQHFQEKYKEDFIELAKKYKDINIWRTYLDLPSDKNTDKIRQELRNFDQLINVDWRLSHYRSAVRYLKSDQGDLEATGGTNWQKYLPPRFQRTIFYPLLWSDEEKNKWGKSWVDTHV